MLLLAFFLQFLLLFDSGRGVLSGTSDAWSLDRCNVALEDWADEALRALKKQQHVNKAHELTELMFFLHVPRTGGRTYHQCLLRHLYPLENHCERSYDELRFNSSTHCRLLVTHDDFSVLEKLPMESTAVITNMRNPVDRVFSAYEFSVEVASRFLGRSKKGSEVTAPAKKPAWSSTLDIWPWSLLVPWMKDDILRRKMLRQQGEDALSLGVSEISNYNASAYLMPLHEFLKQPIVVDLVQNGATFQVAGLTNNSYIKEARDLRRCVSSYPRLGHHVLNVAKRRLDRMLFVGLTDKHKDTAKLFARLVGGQLFPLGMPSNLSTPAKPKEAGYRKPEGVTEFGLVKSTDLLKKDLQSTKSASQVRRPMIPKSQNLTVYGLIDIYENCATRLRNTQIQRRTNSLKNALPVKFSPESRREVAAEILDDIRERNFLDVDLYAYAQQIFSKTETQGFGNSKSSAVDANPSLLDSVLNGGPDSSDSWKLTSGVLILFCAILMTLGAWIVIFSRRNKLRRFCGHNHAIHEKI